MKARLSKTHPASEPFEPPPGQRRETGSYGWPVFREFILAIGLQMTAPSQARVDATGVIQLSTAERLRRKQERT